MTYAQPTQEADDPSPDHLEIISSSVSACVHSRHPVRRACRIAREPCIMPDSDEDAVRELEHRFNAAWDAHDPDGMAESLVDDAQFITVNGAWTTSRAGFRDLMQRLHGANGPYRSSTRRTPEMHVRFLAP